MRDQPREETPGPDSGRDDEFIKADELWFNDGTLFLKAGNTLFSVYGGLLDTVSTFFHNLLSLPPPKEGNDTYQRRPIVVLDDSVEDLTCFLKAIFEVSYFEPPPSVTELRIVESVLRLSHKYDASYFKYRALSHLNSTFPVTLDGWNNRYKTRTIPALYDTPFIAIRIAREFNLDWLLPSILYCICSHPIERTHDPILIQDDVVRQKCLNGRRKLLIMQIDDALHMSMNPVIMGCIAGCPYLLLSLTSMLRDLKTVALLNFFEDVISDYPGKFCPSCESAFRESCASASLKMWQDLPIVFSLPGWKDLEKQKSTH